MRKFASGTKFQGKWTHESLELVRILGEGANGSVYLVSSRHGYAAMKICGQSSDAALEWNVLQNVARTHSFFPRPLLIDDWETAGETFYFYIMEWITGESLDKVLPQLTSEQVQLVIEKITLALCALHQSGVAFCDIKPQNILVAMNGGLAVRFVDVGGVTPFGRAVRQFTPTSDRAFWSLGTRRADAAYDICGLCLSLITAQAKALPKTLYEWSPPERKSWLLKTMRQYPHSWLIPLLNAGLTGAVGEAASFLNACRKASAHSSGNKAAAGLNGSSSNVRGQVRNAGQVMRAKKKMDWTERAMWGSLTLAAVMACVVWVTFLG